MHAINGTNFTYELYEDREDLKIWQNMKASKDNVFVVDRCGNVVANVSTFGEKVRSGFEIAYFNNQTAGMEEACICDVYNWGNDDDGEGNNDDDDDEGDDDEEDDDDEKDDNEGKKSSVTSPEPVADMTDEKKLS